ncbi:50S ribosome-binding GTPase [Vibrio sp. ZSDZ65]|uniref:50S ribosome-binding GTPase n=2 Tax=Vibrio qingdaonensis TaxID=2829491 RepID=A0A9X3CTJ9_9VIBR|nr:50S ribosome-binding GTPase [Vibrio qingdaonensis]
MIIKNNEKPSVESLKAFVAEVRNFKPKVAIMGKSGAGKSSLVNALFGESVSTVSDIGTGTKEVNYFDYEGITLIDFPGLADLNKENEAQFLKMYEEELSDVDLALWIIPANDRANAPDIAIYEQLLKPERERMPTMVILSKQDNMGTPHKKFWDDDDFRPTDKLVQAILEKENLLSNEFDLSTRYISSVATEYDDDTKAYRSFNLDGLVNKIVSVLPNEKKYAITREVDDKNVTSETRIAAEQGLWESMKSFMGDAFDSAKDVASDIIIASLPSALSWVTKKFKFW